MIIFENERAMNGYEECHQMIRTICEDAANFLYDCGHDMIITSTKSILADDIRIGRKSSTHREGRAVDIFTGSLDSFTIKELIRYLAIRYREHGAIKDGVPNLLVYADERHQHHIHLQLNRSFSVNNKEVF